MLSAETEVGNFKRKYQKMDYKRCRFMCIMCTLKLKREKKNVGINKLKMLFGNFDNKESFILCFYIGVFQACFAVLFKMKKNIDIDLFFIYCYCSVI